MDKFLKMFKKEEKEDKEDQSNGFYEYINYQKRSIIEKHSNTTLYRNTNQRHDKLLTSLILYHDLG